MSDKAWRTKPPDSAGIWLQRVNKRTVTPFLIKSEDLLDWNTHAVAEYEFCKLMDLPTITEPIKYREPTMDDVGQMVEVKCGEDWHARQLVWITSDQHYWTISDKQLFGSYSRARIIDTPRPKPREWWLGHDGGHMHAYARKDACESMHGSAIHVREVTP